MSYSTEAASTSTSSAINHITTAPTPLLTISLSTVTTTEESVPVSAVQSSFLRVCFKVVPVRVTGPGGDKQETNYAFLDSRSDITVCLLELVKDLGQLHVYHSQP